MALMFPNGSHSNKVNNWLLHCPRCSKSGLILMLMRKRAMHIGHGMDFPFGPSELLKYMPLDFRKVDVGFWRKSQYALLQSFKMARFLDESSACLNMCTVFSHFNDPNYPDTKFIGLMGIILFLSLKQIRRHDEHLVLHS